MLSALTSLVRRRPLLAGAVALFCLLVAVYSFSAGLRATRGAAITGDEPFYLLTTQSLLQDGNLDLREQYARASYRDFFDHPDGLWQQSVPNKRGELLSPHNPGLSVLLLPGFALGKLTGAQVQLLLIAALTFSLSYVLAARESGSAGLAWLATLGVALAATPFVYSTEVYPEMPAALCLVLCLLLVSKGSRSAPAGLALVALVSALAWLSVKYVPLGAVVACFYLWRAAARERALFVAAAGLSGAVYTWFNLHVFGHLTPYSINTVYEGASTEYVLGSHLAMEDRVYRLWGLFIDQRFGVGRWAPLLLLVWPALPALLRAGRTGFAALLLCLMQIGIATFAAITMMGWWFPGRLLVVVMPLFALALTMLLLRLGNAGRAGVLALALASTVTTSALAVAARSGEVTLAVDPFDMDFAPFRLTAPLFPDYRAWDLATAVRTCAWLAAGGALCARLYLRRRDQTAVRAPGRVRGEARGAA